jgi:hypothetical protein
LNLLEAMLLTGERSLFRGSFGVYYLFSESDGSICTNKELSKPEKNLHILTSKL